VSIVVIGASHRSAPLELLEAMAIDADHLDKALDDLLGREHLSEAVVVSTCNRTEVYVVAERFHGAFGDVRDFFSDLTFLPPDRFADELVVSHDDDAVRHLFRVAAGLESAVVGEHEILGQVRTAWERARQQGSAGSTLNLLFRHALEAGKRARTDTGIARHVTSVSQAAVVMAAEQVGGLAGRRAVVLGAGDMGRGMVHLLAEHDLAELVVVNRSAQRAEELASAHGPETAVRAATYGHLHLELADADVLFTATGSDQPILAPAEMEPLMSRRGGRELLVVDIAVPRDVVPAVGDIPGITLVDMVGLGAFAERGLAERRREIPAVEAIVDDEVDRYSADASSRQVAPLVADLYELGDSVRSTELARHAARLATMSDADRETVEAVTRAVVAKLLHTPTVRVKDAAGTLRGERLAANLRELFDLNEP